jgi:hypothetical protein
MCRAAVGALADVQALGAAACIPVGLRPAFLDSALDREPAESLALQVCPAGVRADCRVVRGRPALVLEARLELRLLVL